MIRLLASALLGIAFAAVLSLGSTSFGDTNPYASAVEMTFVTPLGAGHCSAVYLGHGYFLSAGHCADDIVKMSATDVKIEGHVVTVKSYDTIRDIAFFKTEEDKITIPVAKLNFSPLPVGEHVTIVGWPVDLGEVIGDGKIASKIGPHGPWPVSNIVVAAVAPGNSGGPVYNDKGEVVGIVVGMLGQTSISIIIPVSVIADVETFVVSQ